MRTFRFLSTLIISFLLFVSIIGKINQVNGAGFCTAPQGVSAPPNMQYNTGASVCIKNSDGVTYSKITCGEYGGIYTWARLGDKSDFTCQECTDGDLSNPDVQVAMCTPVTTTYCQHPDIGNSSLYNVNARICLASGFTSTVNECQFDGSWKPIESCAATDCNETQNPPDSTASCNNAIPAPTCQSQALVGQFDPQPGANCGLTASAAEELGYTGDQFLASQKCCYPVSESFGDLNLGCYFEGTVFEKAGEVVDEKIVNFFNRAPFFLYDEDDSRVQWNLKKIKEYSNTIPACMRNAVPIGGDPGTSSCRCEAVALVTGLEGLCKNVSPSEQGDCVACVSDSDVGIWTGLGCVRVGDENSFVQNLLGIGVSIGGGLSLLCIMYASFMLQQSQGNPEKLKKSRELVISCIMGLLLIVFSIFILRFIGYTILRIPGFS